LELDKKARSIIQEIKGIEEIDVIIWAFTDTKRCSAFPDKKVYGLPNHALEKNIVLRAIHDLGLECKDCAVRAKDWLPYEEFFKEHRGAMDLAMGLYYDIPRCCAETFQERHENRINQLLTVALEEDSKELFEEQEKNSFFDKIIQETVTLISANRLPPGLFLLLGQSYVPCQPHCPKFIEQAKKMSESLVAYLGKERTDEIIKKYGAKVTKIYK